MESKTHENQKKCMLKTIPIVGGWATPLKNMTSSIGIIYIPNISGKMPNWWLFQTTNQIPMVYSEQYVNLVGGLNPSEKYEFVNWDDECNPILMGKCQIDGCSSHHQPEYVNFLEQHTPPTAEYHGSCRTARPLDSIVVRETCYSGTPKQWRLLSVGRWVSRHFKLFWYPTFKHPWIWLLQNIVQQLESGNQKMHVNYYPLWSSFTKDRWY